MHPGFPSKDKYDIIKLMIRFWSLIYRLTGWYSPWASLAEYKYIKENMKRIEELYWENHEDMRLDDVIGLEIGTWQAKHGFYRKIKL